MTTKPHSALPLVRAIAGIKRHIEDHPNDAAAQMRLSNLQARLAALPASARRLAA